jgi:hypothetical protein
MSSVSIEPATYVCDECGCVSENGAGSVTLKRHVGAKRIALPPEWSLAIERCIAPTGERVVFVKFICPHHSKVDSKPTVCAPDSQSSQPSDSNPCSRFVGGAKA